MAKQQRARVDAHLASLGATIRRLREARGLTQEQLAHVAGLHRAVVGFIERGERDFGVSTLWPLAAALGVSASALVDETPHSSGAAALDSMP